VQHAAGLIEAVASILQSPAVANMPESEWIILTAMLLDFRQYAQKDSGKEESQQVERYRETREVFVYGLSML